MIAVPNYVGKAGRRRNGMVRKYSKQKEKPAQQVRFSCGKILATEEGQLIEGCPA
jgi:hypothetical protein